MEDPPLNLPFSIIKIDTKKLKYLLLVTIHDIIINHNSTKFVKIFSLSIES